MARCWHSRIGADNDFSHDHRPSDLAELMEVPPDNGRCCTSTWLNG
jgi:hypothetical protein